MSYTAGQKLRATQMGGRYVCTSTTRPPGHVGQEIYETDFKRFMMYDGTQWIQVPQGTAFTGQTDSGTTTSSTYTATRTGTANVAGVAFKAPLSGIVRIDWACGISAVSGIPLVSFQCLTGAVIGSGSSVLAASDSYALQATTTAELKVSDFYYVQGLTPNADYNAQLMYRSSGAVTATFNRPKISAMSA
jgi:hypothetical protein